MGPMAHAGGTQLAQIGEHSTHSITAGGSHAAATEFAGDCGDEYDTGS